MVTHEPSHWADTSIEAWIADNGPGGAEMQPDRPCRVRDHGRSVLVPVNEAGAQASAIRVWPELPNGRLASSRVFDVTDLVTVTSRGSESEEALTRRAS